MESRMASLRARRGVALPPPPPPPSMPIATENTAASCWSTTVIERQCVRSFKHPRLEVDNYIFHFHKKCNKHMRWKCNRVGSFKCPAVLKTTLDMTDVRILSVDHDHTHSNDRLTIVHVQKRLSVMTSFFAKKFSHENTLIILKDTGVFDQQNGKRLYPYNSQNFEEGTMCELFSTSKKTKLNVTNENDYESASSINVRASRSGKRLLDSQNNSLNQSSHNKIEIIKHVDSTSSIINSHEFVHHQTTTVHVNIKSPCSQLRTRKITPKSNNLNNSCKTNQNTPRIECPSTSVEDLRNESIKSNDIIYVLDSDDDDNDNECGKNDEIIKNNGRLEASGSRQKEKFVDFSYSANNQTQTNFETIPLPVNSTHLPSNPEVEVARIHSNTGVVTITVEKSDQNPSSCAILREVVHQSKIISIPEEVPIKNTYGLNSPLSITPFSNENGVPDLSPKDLSPSDEAEGDKKTQQIIDLLLKNRHSCGFVIKNSYSLEQKVPASAPLLSSVHFKLQELLPLNKKRKHSALPPTPRVVLRVNSSQDMSVVHDTLNLDLEFHYTPQKRPLKNIIKRYEVFCLKVGAMDVLDECDWKLVGVTEPVFWPYIMILKVHNGAENHHFYFSVRVLDFYGKYSDFSEPQVIYLKSV